MKDESQGGPLSLAEMLSGRAWRMPNSWRARIRFLNGKKGKKGGPCERQQHTGALRRIVAESEWIIHVTEATTRCKPPYPALSIADSLAGLDDRVHTLVMLEDGCVDKARGLQVASKLVERESSAALGGNEHVDGE